MDIRFGTWNVRDMYRAGSLRVVAGEISKYNIKIDLKRDRMVWTGSIWLRIGTSGGLL
jgi:hypothetical protein